LDVCWGYNNIWIKEGDEWKAAFQMNRGLFKPLVPGFVQEQALEQASELIPEEQQMVHSGNNT